MPPDTKRLKILIVDDDPGVVRLVGRTLRREGYTTAVAGSGQEALAWLKLNQADLLLTDLKLPDIPVSDVLQTLCNQSRPVEVPFVIMTGQGDERVAVDMMQTGALDYVVKDADFLDRLPAIMARAFKQVEQGRKLAEAEAALKQEHEFVSAILQTAGALVLVLDKAGAIVRFNRACERSTGFSAGQMVGQPVWKLFSRPEELASAQELFQRLCNGQEFNIHENHWRSKQGEDRLIAWSNTILHAADGSVEYVIATGIDITERRQLEKELLSIEESVQQRIGHDLHDDLSQRLAGIEIMSQVLEQQLESRSKRMAERASEIAHLVRDAISHTRSLARGLSPVVIEIEGLTAALQQLAESTKSIFDVPCLFECPHPVEIKDLSVATHLYRIAQEAVSNAVRHGDARHIHIALVKTPERISLLVEDDGKGLPEGNNRSRGMGLRIMRYRAGVIGGALAVQKRVGGGTEVVCSVQVPVKSQQRAKR